MDPVCGVHVDIEDALTATYEGRTYYFCSEECREEFREAPEEYVGDTASLLFEDEE